MSEVNKIDVDKKIEKLDFGFKYYMASYNLYKNKADLDLAIAYIEYYILLKYKKIIKDHCE